MTAGTRLDSWKEIAAYLRRDVTTVRRWERLEALPVHRHRHGTGSTVFAFTAEIDAWVRERSTTDRVHALRPTPPLPPGFVGRTNELSWLSERWERAMRGARQLVFVTGELGIGKTALIRHFIDALGHGVSIGEGQSVEQYGTSEPYLPIIDAVRSLFGSSDCRRVETTIRRYAPTWAAQLGMATRRPPSRTPNVDEFGRERCVQEITAALEELASHRPLVVVLEDIHWGDCATIALLDRLARRTRPVQLLIVASYREQSLLHGHPALWRLRQELGAHQHCEELALPLLGVDGVREYLAARAAWDDADAAARWFHRHSDGNPLFLDHLLEYTIETNRVARRDGRWRLAAGTDDGVPVPRSLRDLVLAEVARLPGEVQELLEAASVAGMQCSAALLASVTRQPVNSVERQLDALTRHRVIIQRWPAAEVAEGPVSASYAFVHAMYRQVLYGRLPEASRAARHCEIASYLEAACGHNRPQIAAALAAHYERGQRPLEAAIHYEVMADQAVRLGGLSEMQTALTHALRVSRQLVSGPDQQERELRLRARLCAALTMARPMGDPFVADAYAQLAHLGGRIGHQWEVVHGLLGIARVQAMRGDLVSADDIGEQAIQLARAANCGIASALASQSALMIFRGEYGLSRDLAHQALTVDTDEFESIAVQGYDSTTAAWNNLGWSSWALGEFSEMLVAAEQNLLRASRVQHTFTTAFVNAWSAPLFEYAGDSARSRQVLALAADITKVHPFVQVNWWVDAAAAWLGARDGRVAEGIGTLRTTVESLDRGGLRTLPMWVWAWLAEALLLNGAADEALEVIGQAIQRGVATGAHYHEVEFLRLRGEALMPSDPPAAEAVLREALALAHDKHAAGFHLRAAVSLSRLLFAQGRAAEIRTMLAPICARFAGSYETPDVRRARRWLDRSR